MSPAMVDFRSPAAPSSPLEPKPSPPRNPSKGEISAHRSPSFGGRSEIPASGRRPNHSSVFGFVGGSGLGQRNAGSRVSTDAGFGGSFASPAPPVPSSPFHPVSASRKPPSAPGLSKPRLVKARKHFASPRVRPAVIVDAEDDFGFNPFHSQPVCVESDALEQNQGRGVQQLNEKVHGRKPFETEGGLKVSEDVNSGNLKSAKPESSGFAMSDVGFFVFGNGAKKGSNSRRSTRKKNVKSENTGYESNKSVKNVGTGEVVEGTFGFGSFPSGSPGTGTFVFGSGMKKNPISEQGPPVDSSDQSKGKFASVKSESAGFVFGASSVLNLGTKDNGFGNKPDHNPHSDGFIFRSDLKQSSNSPWNSLENSSGPSCGNFEFGKFVNFGTNAGVENICSSSTHGIPSSFVGRNSGNTDRGIFISGSVQSKSDSSCGNEDSGLGGHGSTRSECAIFGASTFGNFNSKDIGSKEIINNVISEGSEEPNTGASVCGSGTRLSSSLGQISSMAVDVSTVSRLHDEMGKLNLQCSGNEVDPEKTKQAASRAEVNEGNIFVFGKSKSSLSSSGGADLDKINLDTENSVPLDKNGGERNRSFDAGAFLFGGGMKIDSNMGQNSFFASNEGLFSSCPDEMKKLNLQSSGNDDNSEKTKQADQRAMFNEGNIFVFGCSSNCQSYFSGPATDTLPEVMNKLNTGNETASANMRNDSQDHPAGVFVFGSNLKKTSTSVQMSASEIHLQKLKTEGIKSDDPSTRIKDTGYPCKVDVTNGVKGFTFGVDYKVSGPFGGSAVNPMYEDMKLNIRNKTKNSVGKLERTRNSSLGAHTHCKFTSQAGKQDTNSHLEDIQLSKMDDNSRLRGEATPFDPSSSVHISQSVWTGFTFTSRCEELKSPHMEFTTPIHVTPELSKESLFTGPRQSRASNVKTGESRTTRKKRRDKSKQSVPLYQNSAQTFALVGEVLESMEQLSPGSYSPMDYSPYPENLVVDQSSRETSVTSNESDHIFSYSESMGTKKSISVDERNQDMVFATHDLDVNKDGVTLGGPENSGSGDYVERDVVAKSLFTGKQITEHSKESYLFQSDKNDLTSTCRTTGKEADAGPCSSKFEPQASESEKCFTPNSILKGFTGSNFSFGVLPFAQGPLSASKCQHRRKSRMKGSKNLNNLTPNANVPLAPPSENLFPVASSMQPVAARDLKGMPCVPQSGDDVRAETHPKLKDRKYHIPTTAATVAEQEACDKWRLRGNQAYSNGDMSKAEEFYTRGVNSISIKEVSRSSNRALMLCYSNRAASRMSLGRMREALSDCMMASAIDPSFLRAQVRAANCHLALGEIEDALKYFKNCLQSDNGGSLGQKILIEASNGLLKAQQAADYMVQSEELMLKRSSNEAAKTLEIISKALLICPYSERLMERKAEALLVLRSYEEVILFCEQTIQITERNSSVNRVNIDNSEDMQSCSLRLWCWRLMSKSYFYLGRFEKALELLKKNGTSESLASLFGTIQELLHLKAAGNKAFQAGKHLDAVEHYSSALACNTESLPFTAICFCNRAAAYQALGQITDAIADCSIAIALDSSYPKAISRRATLHEMIRDYGQASNDLHKLLSLLEKQFKDKGNQAGVLGRVAGNSDLNWAHVRLRTVEEEARKETPLDLYMILGIEPSGSLGDVKKAYRKAALRHHPDKAGQLLARSENIDDGLWREVADEVHRDADRLFKMIGEAYTVLSDPTKRLQYDAEEELRMTLRKGYSVRSTYKTEDNCTSPFDRSSSRRQWRAYGSSHQRGSESSRCYK